MEENIIMVPGSGTKVIVRDVKQEIETAFLDYSMSVIVARAARCARRSLKPVHRRILYTMDERGNDPRSTPTANLPIPRCGAGLIPPARRRLGL